MRTSLSIKNALDSLIPISRFNRGEAGKIFEEVNEDGVKVVIKNNVPACVLLSVDRFRQIADTLDEYALFLEAERRMSSCDEAALLSHEEVLREFAMSEAELEAAPEVEIE